MFTKFDRCCVFGRAAAGLLLLAVAARCGDDGGAGGGDELPALITISPADSATDISVAARVTASITLEGAQSCRFAPDNSTFVVTQGGTVVPGALVYFVDGLRVDFTPSGMFAYDTAYRVEATLECSAAAGTVFTTRSEPATTPGVVVGQGFRFSELRVDEPAAIANIIRDFLRDGLLLMQVLEIGAGEIRMIAGEGRDVVDPPLSDAFLRAFKNDPFLFPMTGVYRPPYFQVEGTISVPVDDDTDLTLEHFEISGRFVDNGASIEIGESAIRASSPCDDVCAVDDADIQLVCGNRSTICTTGGDLNLIGNYVGAPNDIAAYQSITTVPADGATDVAAGSSIAITLTAPVNDARTRAVVVELTDGAGSDVAGTVVVDSGGMTATFTPDAALTAATNYTALVIAHSAVEVAFSTAP